MNRILVGCLAGLVLLAGCTGESFKAPSGGGAALQNVKGDFELLPPTDKIDEGCINSADYDACIFYKNPIYSKNAPLKDFARGRLNERQTLGVKLIGLNGSGFLENSTFRVETISAARVSLSGQIKKLAADDPNKFLEQLMTYYYYNLALTFWEPLGPVAFKNQNLKVIADDQVSGWKYDTKTIHLGRLTSGLNLALDASQSLYFLGLANVSLANSNAINQVAQLTGTHKFCNQDVLGCCTTQFGCARAIQSGAALYFVANLFPSNPRLGELSENAMRGIKNCDKLERNPLSASSLSASSAYSLCSSAKGDVHIMGTLYASIWLAMKKQAGADADDINRLYLEHLATLTATDTFSTVKTKLLGFDQTLFNAKYNQLINTEFSRRKL